MKIRIKRLHPDAAIPTKATEGSAAYDLFAPDFVALPGRSVIHLGIAIELPVGYCAKIKGRSGYDSKGMEGYLIGFGDKTERFDVDVKIGLIDSDYRGEIGVIINNRSGLTFALGKGQRIAQMTIEKVEDVEFEEVDELSETERGKGGYGSTGR